MPFDDRLNDAFLAVAAHRSIGRAAEALNISQPTLSRMIKRLEQKLGAPLFDRYATGVALTSYGEALLPFSSQIERERSHAWDEIQRLRGGSHGVLRLGSVVSPGITFVPPILRQLIAESPGLRVELMEAVSEVLEVALLERSIDVMVAGELPHNEDVVRMSYAFEDTGSVVAAAAHPARELGPVTLADLTDYSWVMPPKGTVPRQAFERVVTGVGLKPPHIAVETRSVTMMKSLVADSNFLSWLPRPLYAIEERANLILPLDVAGMFIQRRSHIYRRKHGSVPPPVIRFLEIARSMRNERR